MGEGVPVLENTREEVDGPTPGGPRARGSSGPSDEREAEVDRGATGKQGRGGEGQGNAEGGGEEEGMGEGFGAAKPGEDIAADGAGGIAEEGGGGGEEESATGSKAADEDKESESEGEGGPDQDEGGGRRFEAEQGGQPGRVAHEEGLVEEGADPEPVEGAGVAEADEGGAGEGAGEFIGAAGEAADGQQGGVSFITRQFPGPVESGGPDAAVGVGEASEDGGGGFEVSAPSEGEDHAAADLGIAVREVAEDAGRQFRIPGVPGKKSDDRVCQGGTVRAVEEAAEEVGGAGTRAGGEQVDVVGTGPGVVGEGREQVEIPGFAEAGEFREGAMPEFRAGESEIHEHATSGAVVGERVELNDVADYLFDPGTVGALHSAEETEAARLMGIKEDEAGFAGVKAGQVTGVARDEARRNMRGRRIGEGDCIRGLGALEGAADGEGNVRVDTVHGAGENQGGGAGESPVIGGTAAPVPLVAGARGDGPGEDESVKNDRRQRCGSQAAPNHPVCPVSVDGWGEAEVRKKMEASGI